MQRIVDPRQNKLFDSYGPVLTETTRRRLLAGWSGVFRHVILELMPVDVLGGHFSPRMGRPTRELYSMAGLVLLMEFMDWTKPQALDAYSFHLEVQYALNLEPVAHDLSMRTLERYIQHFEQDDLARRIMHEVTTRLVGVLGTRIDQQRLDSTHVFSDMACLGRTRLMGVAIKRFLTQVKRHDPAAYAELDGLSGNWHYERSWTPKGWTFKPTAGGTGEDAPQAGFDTWRGGWRDYHEWLRRIGQGGYLEKHKRLGNHNDAPSGQEGSHIYSQLDEKHHMAAFFTEETTPGFLHKSSGITNCFFITNVV